jgi:predicted dehydrogenase
VSARLRVVATVDGGANVRPVDGVGHLRSVAQLAEVEPIDFVDICTPTASHVDLTVWALEQGYHVLCEKPVATTVAEARRIADAARRAGRVVMPCHQYRYNPAWLQLREWLDGGLIGRWHIAEFHVYRTMADRGASSDATPWRGIAEHSRGGVLLDHGTHYIYQVLDIAGLPRSVSAWTGRLRHADYNVEDSAHLRLDYGDRLCTMFLTWAAHHRENRVRIIGEDGMIEWTGGLLRLDRGSEVLSLDFSPQLQKSSYHTWFSSLFRAFTYAMDTNTVEPHVRDIEDVARVVEEGYGGVVASSEGTAERSEWEMRRA